MIPEVTIPQYCPNDPFHHKIIEFVKSSLNDSKTTSFMGLMEKYAFFSLAYDAPECRFILSVCYEDGKTWTRAYDKFEYCEWREGDTEETVQWNLQDVTIDIINDIEAYSTIAFHSYD